MEGLRILPRSLQMGRRFWSLRTMAHHCRQRYGWPGVFLIACGVAVAIVGGFALHATRNLEALRAVQINPGVQPTILSAAASPASNRERLLAFDAALLSEESVPDVLQDLIAKAEAHRLLLARGEYAQENDVQGGFLRWRMTLPLKGEAESIHAFLLAALQAHRSLALESVQFKRERVDAKIVEARVQWVLFVRPGAVGQLPRGPQGVAAESGR